MPCFSSSGEVESQPGKTAPSSPRAACQRRPREEVPPRRSGGEPRRPRGAAGGSPRPARSLSSAEGSGRGLRRQCPCSFCPGARALEVEVCNRGASLKLTLFPVYRCSYLVRVVNGLDVYLGYRKPVRKCLLKPSLKPASSLQSLLS